MSLRQLPRTIKFLLDVVTWTGLALLFWNALSTQDKSDSSPYGGSNEQAHQDRNNG
jgi:threonine/homoserine/homoserine lactone efflux protein